MRGGCSEARSNPGRARGAGRCVHPPSGGLRDRAPRRGERRRRRGRTVVATAGRRLRRRADADGRPPAVHGAGHARRPGSLGERRPLRRPRRGPAPRGDPRLGRVRAPRAAADARADPGVPLPGRGTAAGPGPRGRHRPGERRAPRRGRPPRRRPSGASARARRTTGVDARHRYRTLGGATALRRRTSDADVDGPPRRGSPL